MAQHSFRPPGTAGTVVRVGGCVGVQEGGCNRHTQDAWRSQPSTSSPVQTHAHALPPAPCSSGGHQLLRTGHRTARKCSLCQSKHHSTGSQGTAAKCGDFRCKPGPRLAPAVGCTTSAPVRPPAGRRDVATWNALQCSTQHASRRHSMLYASLHPTATCSTHSAAGAVICSEKVRFALGARAIVLRVQLTSADFVALHQEWLGAACSGGADSLPNSASAPHACKRHSVGTPAVTAASAGSRPTSRHPPASFLNPFLHFLQLHLSGLNASQPRAGTAHCAREEDTTN